MLDSFENRGIWKVKKNSKKKFDKIQFEIRLIQFSSTSREDFLKTSVQFFNQVKIVPLEALRWNDIQPHGCKWYHFFPDEQIICVVSGQLMDSVTENMPITWKKLAPSHATNVNSSFVTHFVQFYSFWYKIKHSICRILQWS